MSHISLTYHIVWRTKCSRRTITESHERDLYAYILSIINNKHCHLHRINSMPDHIHMCLEIHPTISVSDIIRVIKQESSKWIKERRDWFPTFDGWGNGYAAFTYSYSERANVINYIKEQKEHHKRLSFKEEYENILQEFGLDPNEDLFLKD